MPWLTPTPSIGRTCAPLKIDKLCQVGQAERLSGEHRLEDWIRGFLIQCDPKCLFDHHEEFDQIEAIAMEVFDQAVTR